jgi:hypothetical protein
MDKSDLIHNAVEDKIIDGLDFKLRPGASYVLNRRFVTFHPSGSNIYTAKSLIKIVLTGSNDWLDPSTLRVMFSLKNNNATAAKLLRPLGGPWCFFRRMRILCGGTLVEDIDMYNRTHQMFNQLTAHDSRKNKWVEGLFTEMDLNEVALELSKGLPTTDDSAGSIAPIKYTGINGGYSKTCLFKPLSGLFSQNRYLPLKYCGPIIIELETVSEPTDPIMMINTTKTASTENDKHFSPLVIHLRTGKLNKYKLNVIYVH